ncbi:MAG: hypothetical protein ACXV5P_06635 [Halobacteriota archaeon]
MATGTIVTTVEDAIAVAFQILESAKNEIVWLIPRLCSPSRARTTSRTKSRSSYKTVGGSPRYHNHIA